MTFKEARAEARKYNGAYIGVFKDGGWFVNCHHLGRDSREVFFVMRDGSLIVVNTDFARQYQKKHFANMQKKLDMVKKIKKPIDY